MTIMAGRAAAGSPRTGAEAESSHVRTTTMRHRDRANWKWTGLFKSQSPVTYLLQQSHTSRATASNSDIPCRPIGAIFFQTTIDVK